MEYGLKYNILSNLLSRFSVGKLPSWAKSKIIESSSPSLAPPSDVGKGRWGRGAFTDTPFSAPATGEEEGSPKDNSSLEWAR